MQANYSGADGFLITTVGGKISSASVCIALGATVQKTQRRKKKIGKDDRDRLLAFFWKRRKRFQETEGDRELIAPRLSNAP